MLVEGASNPQQCTSQIRLDSWPSESLGYIRGPFRGMCGLLNFDSSSFMYRSCKPLQTHHDIFYNDIRSYMYIHNHCICDFRITYKQVYRYNWIDQHMFFFFLQQSHGLSWSWNRASCQKRHLCKCKPVQDNPSQIHSVSSSGKLTHVVGDVWLSTWPVDGDPWAYCYQALRTTGKQGGWDGWHWQPNPNGKTAKHTSCPNLPSLHLLSRLCTVGSLIFHSFNEYQCE